MQITISDNLKIKTRAEAAGFATVEEYVRDLLERDAAQVEESAGDIGRDIEELSAEEWVADFRAFIQSLPSRNPNFDDSRESIYPVR